MKNKTHHINSGVELKNEFQAALLAILDSGHSPAVRPLSQLLGEGTQSDIVAQLLLIKVLHSFCLQLCHKGEKHEISP